MVRRSVLLVVLALVLVLVAAACGGRGGVSIAVSPSEVTLAPGETQEFTATVQGARDALVEWSATGGDLVASGPTAVFTAPTEVGEYTVTARSARDRGRWASASVTVEASVSSPEEEPVSLDVGPGGGELELDSGVGVVVPGFRGDEAVRFTLSRLSVGDAVGVGLQAGATYSLRAERDVGVESVTVRLPVVGLSRLEVPVVTYFVDGVPERVTPALVDGVWVVEVPVDVGVDALEQPGIASQGAERSSVDWRVVFGFSRVVPVVYVFGDGRQVMGEARTSPCYDSRTMEDLSCFVFFDDDGVFLDTSVVGVPDAILAVERDDGKEQFAVIVDVGKELLSTFLVAYEFAGLEGSAGVALLASISQPIWQLQFAAAAQSAVIRWFGQFNPTLTDYLTYSALHVDFMSAASDWGVELTSSFVLTVPKFNARCPYSFCNILQVRVEDAFDAGSVSYRDVWFWLHESTSDELFVLKAPDQSLGELVGEIVGAEANFCRARGGGIETHVCSNFELRLVAVGLIDRGWWGLGSDRIVRMLVNSDAFALGDVSPRRAPEIELLGPEEPETSFAWTVSADYPIDSVEFRFNDEAWEATSPADSVTRSLSSGGHTFELMAVDAAGLRTTEAREFTVGADALPGVSIEPSSVTLDVSGTQSFTATVTGVSDTSVTWDASCGSIGETGNPVTYTAPATAGECEVTATSVADSTKSATTSVTVTGGGADFEPAPSYISISNVSLGAASGGTRPVSFDISWDESWRGPDRPTWVEAPDNWDAAWVFVKYRVSGGPWQHATLAGSGHLVPSGAVVEVPSDRVGAFVYRSSSGYGTFTANGVGLQWDYVADGVSAGASVEVRPFGIEMVYVPQGAFSVGSGGENTGEFRAGGTANMPFVVSSQASIALGDGSGQLMWTATTSSGSPSGTTSASFPTGYGAFYVMKYQITQKQYVDFLNTLTQAQADARKYTGSDFRFAITGDSVGSYATSLPFVALNYASWWDGVAFADWAGLRPMTELEFEKVARGPLGPVANEYAWGSTSITQATGLANAGTITETPTPTGANANYWSDGNPISGPVRVGSFAAPGRSRQDAGAGYYGALELSGNLWERPVTVGSVDGREFAGTHGDGVLDAGGNANVSSWPGNTGHGLRGGRWSVSESSLRVSNRHGAAGMGASGFSLGWRGARSAP